MDSIRSGAARVGACACHVNNAVQTRFSKIFFPFNDLEIPPKLRKQAWAFRISYISWTVGQTVLVFYCPKTYLWHYSTDGLEYTLNAHAAWTLLLMVLISWFFYFQVQASNPGYITGQMLHRFNTKHDVFGVGDNGEGDSFSGYVFRKLTDLGRRAVTTARSLGSADQDQDGQTPQPQIDSDSDSDSESESENDTNQQKVIDDDDDDSSSSGEEDGELEEQKKSTSAADDVRIQIDDDDKPDGPAQQPVDAKTEEENLDNQSKPSAKALRAESMARVERYLAGQDKGRAKKYRVPKRKKAKSTGGDGDGKDDGESKYEGSRFIRENNEIGLGDADDGTFQTRMDFEDIKDDFPLRAKYCKQADRVVPKFDHYCDMLGTPIGERNHALFWMFLIAQSLILVHAISIVGSGFTGSIIWNGPTNWTGRNALLIVNMITLGLPATGMLGLLGFHTWCALTDTLTHEFIKNNELDYLQHFGPCDLPYSKGPVRNFYRFFVVQPGWCISSKDWLPTKYAPPEQFYRNSGNCCLHPWENKYYRCC